MTSPTPKARATYAYAGDLGAVALAVGWFFHLGYGPTLNPTFVAWMFRGDWSTYFWGFTFFRNSDWGFPLGAIPDLFYPYGSSVGFMDANPWLAMLFRVLSPVLPQDFQFSGFWFLLCYALQALFGARVSAIFTRDPVERALGGALFALTPILPPRSVHIALCGLFFLTASLALSLSVPTGRADALRKVGYSLALLAWAAGTHGYLSVMLLALSLALYAQLWLTDRVLRAREFAAALTASLVTVLSVYGLFGYIGFQETDLTAEGFGQFSADLLSLFNPQGHSRFMPDFAFHPRQHEGFAYLGTGVGLLLLIRLVTLLSSLRKAHEWRARTAGLRRLWPLLSIVLLMAVYALSSRITLGGKLLLNLDALYAPLERLTGIFRSSGRFLWPLHLLLLTAAISTAAGMRSRTLGRTLLLSAVLLQASEFRTERLNFSAVSLLPLKHPVWQTLGEEYRHLQVVPLHLLWECRYNRKLIDSLSMQAYRNRLTLNSGNYMRKQPQAKRLCDKHIPTAESLDPNTLYIVDRDYVPDFRRKDAVCGRIDGLTLCAAAARDSALIRSLRERP